MMILFLINLCDKMENQCFDVMFRRSLVLNSALFLQLHCQFWGCQLQILQGLYHLGN